MTVLSFVTDDFLRWVLWTLNAREVGALGSNGEVTA